MIWKKVARTTGSEGTTIVYQLGDTDCTVESRRRHIPHANGKGTWVYVSYFVMRGKAELREFQRFADAKAYAEKLVKD